MKHIRPTTPYSDGAQHVELLHDRVNYPDAVGCTIFTDGAATLQCVLIVRLKNGQPDICHDRAGALCVIPDALADALRAHGYMVEGGAK